MARYKGRHRQSSSSLLKRGKVAIPTTAVVAGAVAAGAVSTANGATFATASMSFNLASTAVDTRNVSGPNQSVSRTASRASVAIDARVKAATVARAKAKAAAASRATTLKAAARKQAALSAVSTGTSAQDYVEAATASQRKTVSSAPGAVTSSGRTGTPTFAGGGRATCAIAACAGTFTSGYGYRHSPGGIGSTNHKGVDIAVPVGTPLRSMQAGTVTAVGYFGGLGMRVEIDFGNGVSTVYGHMSGFAVSPGQKVAAGQLVGFSGNTGNSTGPHLHVEVHINGTPINPYPWLSSRGLI